jgi:hypothetical protein
MNKRQKKKRRKNVSERIKFFNQYVFYLGRQNGKTIMNKAMKHACLSKRYKPFKELKNFLEKASTASVITIARTIIFDKLHKYKRQGR